MRFTQFLKLLLLCGSCLPAAGLRAQHGHLNAGAIGVNQGDPLYFANGAAFAASSGYVKELFYTNSGTYAGFFEGNISFTALPATTNFGGPVPSAPALGSFVQVRMESVAGPAGGSFSFWEGQATSPTVSMMSGALTPSPVWALSDASEGAGQPGADPFGHLHGRRFTADQSGVYTVGFRLLETSVNGPGGSAIHSPSDILYINFAAVPEPGVLAVLGVGGILLLAAWRRRSGNGRGRER